MGGKISEESLSMEGETIESVYRALRHEGNHDLISPHDGYIRVRTKHLAIMLVFTM